MALRPNLLVTVDRNTSYVLTVIRHLFSIECLNSVLLKCENLKAFNQQEKVLVGAFSVIVKSLIRFKL